MVAYLILGATYAFAAAVQPGPLQTYLVSQALRHGWRRTVPAALAPLVSDGPIILLVLLVLTHLPPRVELGLRLAGGVFLLYLAANAWKAWRDYQASRPNIEASAKRGVLSAALVNLLNPNPYLGWTLVLGPLLLQGWHERPSHGMALLVGFYGTMVLTVAVIITLFAGARSFGPRIGRALVGASAVALACFGGYQLWVGIKALVSR
jgi:threonine/homoserine/homoserine lactone efflux protein